MHRTWGAPSSAEAAFLTFRCLWLIWNLSFGSPRRKDCRLPICGVLAMSALKFKAKKKWLTSPLLFPFSRVYLLLFSLSMPWGCVCVCVCVCVCFVNSHYLWEGQFSKITCGHTRKHQNQVIERNDPQLKATKPASWRISIQPWANPLHFLCAPLIMQICFPPLICQPKPKTSLFSPALELVNIQVTVVGLSRVSVFSFV